jgi:hypothetical protein
LEARQTGRDGVPHNRMADLARIAAAQTATDVNEYRAYLMRPDGHILSLVDLVCGHEEAAKERAKQLVDGHDVELWQHDRQIATFTRNQ